MFLKSLSLKGFKSFAESTTLELEPGVTVVVGPNGSGKSNVVDAIAWVLGAQAPSSVRSQKMDDVIFAGTAKRAALGRAEVSLTIDNSSGILPLDFSEVTVRRTLFRSGESEYAINDVPCRLLDVQELLSDAGVGRQQHVIISQGQIDAVLNARPEDRRSIIEEAAGVLKFRKRKEKAERRLDATEANLLRVQDLLREVRRQLRPLERQAEAARRHDELAGELRTLRIFVAGRDLVSLRTRLTAIAGAKQQHGGDEERLKHELTALDSAIVALGAELSATGATDVSDRLAKAEQLRERARGLAALIAERIRGYERDRGQLLDEGVIASLEADAARYRSELADAQRAIAETEPELEVLAADEAAFEVERAELLASIDQAPTSSASSALAEVRGELRTRRSSIDRASNERGALAGRLERLDVRLGELNEARDRFRHDCTATELAEGPLVDEIEAAEARRADAAQQLDLAHVARQHAAEAKSSALARVEALEAALDAARARAGAERLAGQDGVLGTLLELVAIDEGWEPAVEAALGEALAAVVIDDPAAARAALRSLQESGTAGAVLALGAPRPPVPTSTMSTPTVEGAAPVRPHVSSPRSDVAALLDALLAEAVRVDDVDAAIDVIVARPTAVVVTPDGDRLGATGWSVGAATVGGVTAAALDDARRHAELAAVQLDQADAARTAAAEALAAAERREADVVARLDSNDARFTAASEGLARTQTELREATAELDSLRQRIDELDTALAADRERLAELEAVLPDLEASESAEAAAQRNRREVRAGVEARAAVLAGRRRDLDVTLAGHRQRAVLLEQRLTETEQRLQADVEARAAAEGRRVVIDRSLAALGDLAAFVEQRRSMIDVQLADLGERRRRQSDQVKALSTDLDARRQRRSAAERELDGVREKARRAEVDEAEARMRLESAVELLRHDLDIEPEAAEAAEPPPLPDGVSAPARVRELDRELRLLGPINPLALEEFTELQQRHEFLEAQLEDVRTTRRELSRVIKAIDEEIQSVFGSAFADVAGHFESLFGGLFPGGSGRLSLTTPDDLLNTGIEVEAKPGGKNVKKLSLLSGGERSLTALAFLFAVFRSRPSPFYVMDEVEAALDDVNLHRFLGLVAEFRAEAQLIIVSHQKRTMEAGDCLFGVTMQPGGSSRVIAERVSA